MKPHYLIILLKISAFCVLFGRAIKHIFWDAPFRIIFWDENLMNPILQFFNTNYNTFVASANTDLWIQGSIKMFGIILLLISILVLFINKKNKSLSKLLIFASCCLLFLSYLFYVAKFKLLGQFIEYSCQMFSPLFLYLFMFTKINVKKHFNLILKTALALTFVGHGLYAVGFYKTPAVFLNMTYNCFAAIGISLTNTEILTFLKIAGILDFLIAVAIFFPKKIAKPFLIWAIIWGFLTSFARLLSNLYLDFSVHTFNQWVPEFIFRIPHFVIPICVFYITYHYLNSEKIKNNVKQILNNKKRFKKAA